jgi:ABC-type sugar transport system substrate-binding protein
LNCTTRGEFTCELTRPKFALVMLAPMPPNRTLGRAADCAVVGHSAEPEGRAELRQPRTSLIGSVAYFPEKYGAGVIWLALDILAGQGDAPGHVHQA